MKAIFSGVPFMDRHHIARVLRVAIKELGQPNRVTVSVSMVDSDTIAMLNSRDRQIDRATDVLSYPFLQLTAGDIVDMDSDGDMHCGRVLLGDIIICKDIAVAQAQQYGHSVRRELCYLAVHSLLHLLGYDHMCDSDEQLMTATADSIMKKAGINR